MSSDSESNDSRNDPFDCSICQEIMIEPCVLICQHVFCLACIAKVKPKVCPICRLPFILPKGQCGLIWGLELVECGNELTVRREEVEKEKIREDEISKIRAEVRAAMLGTIMAEEVNTHQSLAFMQELGIDEATNNGYRAPSNGLPIFVSQDNQMARMRREATVSSLRAMYMVIKYSILAQMPNFVYFLAILFGLWDNLMAKNIMIFYNVALSMAYVCLFISTKKGLSGLEIGTIRVL
jgi:hypothetical protein